jgi:hypothetical protein
MIDRWDDMAKKKQISRQRAPQDNSLAVKPDDPPDPGSALKNAIEQIRLLETQRDELLEELAFLEITLQDLAASRLDNMSLRFQKDALEHALREYREKLAKFEGQLSESS